jgi:lipopolysaccharide export system permease protein
MGSIDGYIVRTMFSAFAVVLVSLTGLIWITQALREIDLMTSQGQTILVFLGVTSLAIPTLLLLIAPISIALASAHVLNKLANDSEIIVMNAAGLPPKRLLRPFLIVGLIVALGVAFLAAYLAPDGLRRLKRWDTEITADIVSNVLQPGRFATIEQGLTLRVRERQAGGALRGIFVDDRRDPNERLSIIADRGTMLKNDSGTFLILERGSLQRFQANQRDPALVVFDRYAFDLSKYTNMARTVPQSVRDRYIWDLAWPAADDKLYELRPGQYRSELHDRILAPIYLISFVVITFAFLGAPRTTRQSRAFSMVAALLTIFGMRVAGFALSVLANNSPFAVVIQYLMVAGVTAGAGYIVARGIVIEPSARLSERINALTERFMRRFATA